MKQRTLVMGDPHGGLRAIEQVLERAKFNYSKDKLIVLGDIADGWPETAESLDFLIEKVKQLVFIRGNHDQWLKQWLHHGDTPRVWTKQGGDATLLSYLKNPELKTKHLEFLKKTSFFYLDEKSRLFVHGGFNPNHAAEETSKQDLMWSRELWEMRENYEKINRYSEVYVGHTSIYYFSKQPINKGNVWFVDTGGGYEGVLSVMDIDTKEVWQSDLVLDLYPELKNARLQQLEEIIAKLNSWL